MSAPTQHEKIAQEGRNSVTKHLRDQFIWSKPPISQIRNTSQPRKAASLLTSQLVAARVCPTHWGQGRWVGLSWKDRETEKRGRQPVQILAVSTRSQKALQRFCGTPILEPEETKIFTFSVIPMDCLSVCVLSALLCNIKTSPRCYTGIQSLRQK